VVGILADLRFDPAPTRDATEVRLRACPILDAAKANPDIVCSVHLGIVRGALDQLGAARITGSIWCPSPSPGLACSPCPDDRVPDDRVETTGPTMTTTGTTPRTAGTRTTTVRRAARPAGIRLALLVPGGLALLGGLDAALLLLGIPAPVSADRLAAAHGVLLVLGFVGTVIALERAVALGSWWGYAAPALTGVGAVAVASPLPAAVGGGLLVGGTALLALVFVPLWHRRRDPAVLIQAMGAALAVGAAVLHLGGVEPSRYLTWLAGFVVLVIAGERLELMRLTMAGVRAESLLLACAATLPAAALAALLFPSWGLPLAGSALLLLVAVLARSDTARHMVTGSGLPRFSAVALLAGYAWLGVAGMVLVIDPDPTAGGGYDALVHAVFLGFTLSMIMAHAPVILPAVLRRPLPYRPAMYLPLALLHAALLVRIVLGDARGMPVAWQVGGVGNVVALLLFVVIALSSALRAARMADPR
jgi:hypothetical protein